MTVTGQSAHRRNLHPSYTGSPELGGNLRHVHGVFSEGEGAALAHFAVALPFDKSSDSAIRSGMDKAVYPRATLLEALVRYVTADLEAQGMADARQ